MSQEDLVRVREEIRVLFGQGLTDSQVADQLSYPKYILVGLLRDYRPEAEIGDYIADLKDRH